MPNYSQTIILFISFTCIGTREGYSSDFELSTFSNMYRKLPIISLDLGGIPFKATNVTVLMDVNYIFATDLQMPAVYVSSVSVQVAVAILRFTSETLHEQKIWKHAKLMNTVMM